MTVDFTVIIGAANHWPLTLPDHDFALPRALMPTHERFTRFYNNAHRSVCTSDALGTGALTVEEIDSGRKLNWHWQNSKTEVKTSSFDKKYTFLCNLYQATVLLLFNDSTSLTISEIEGATKLPVEKLGGILGILVKAKVLTKDEDMYDLNFSE